MTFRIEGQSLDEFAAGLRKLAEALKELTTTAEQAAKSYEMNFHDWFHDATWYPERCQICRDEMAGQDMDNEGLRYNGS
jgi:hypothetical protein